MEVDALSDDNDETQENDESSSQRPIRRAGPVRPARHIDLDDQAVSNHSSPSEGLENADVGSGEQAVPRCSFCKSDRQRVR
jgi:hypothetical protein